MVWLHTHLYICAHGHTHAHITIIKKGIATHKMMQENLYLKVSEGRLLHIPPIREG